MKNCCMSLKRRSKKNLMQNFSGIEAIYCFPSSTWFIVCCAATWRYPCSFLQVPIGYIRGTIFDFEIFGLLYENTYGVQLVILGIMNFIVFYYVLKLAIEKFNLETEDMVSAMADDAIVFGMANSAPEIMPEEEVNIS